MSADSDMMKILDPSLFQIARDLAEELASRGGNLLLVGGSVRDLVMGFSPIELDLEARGLDLEQVKSILNEKYRYNEVGKAFGVLRLRDKPVEIALPRTEVKSGKGHKGFNV